MVKKNSLCEKGNEMIPEHILHHIETFQVIPTYYLNILYSVRTFSEISGNSSANNELVAKTFRICKNFLESQKLSGVSLTLLLLFSFLTFGIFADNDLWLRDIGTSVGGPGSPLPCTVR